MLFLSKSLVHAHARQNKSGSVSFIADYQKKPDHPKGTVVVFKPDGGKSVRQGTIVGVGKVNYKIDGKRNNAGQVETHIVPKHIVKTLEEHEAAKQRQSSGKRVVTSTSKRVIAVDESNRRAETGFNRLGMSETDVLQHPKVKGHIIAATHKLALSNGYNTAFNRNADFINVEDPDYQDMIHEYAMGMINALRRETANSPDKDIADFKQHLNGDVKNSRIFGTMSTEGKGSAIRYLKQRQEEKNDLVDISEVENPNEESGAGQRRSLSSALSVPANQENDLQGTTENGIERFLSKLPTFDAGMIRLKFGLGNYDLHTNDQIADILNNDGHKYQGKYKWDRNHVGAATMQAVTKLRSVAGIDELRDFLKSLKEHLTLIKAEKQQKTICIDFDGVIADYSAGFQGKDIFGELLKDPETGLSAADVLPGYKDAGWKIIIFTTRADTPKLREYLAENKVPFDEINENSEQPKGSNPGKPIADIYLDDRAEKFTKWAKAVKLAHLEKSLAASHPYAEVVETDNYTCLVFPDRARLAKSYSAEMSERYQGAKWIDIKKGPLEGRRVFAVAHALLQKSHNDGYTDKTPDETGGVYDPASSTHAGTTRFHSDEVAGASKINLTKSGSNCKGKSFPFMGALFLSSLRAVVS